MARARRTKRDSVTNIYRGCKAAGTCPPDVLNKVEQTTIADQILKYGSTAVFFGGLGISTGKGTGGTTGYVPLGEGPGVRVGGTPTVVRPGLIPEAIGPTELIPLDTVNPIDPAAPSIVPLTESGPDLLPGEIETIAEVHPVSEATPVDTPVVTGGKGSSAVLEVADPSPPTRSRVSRTQYHNPSFQIISESTPTTGESSLADQVVVETGSGGQIIGGGPPVEIELEEFPSRYTFEIEEPTPPRRTSTPIRRIQDAARSLRRTLYNRRLTQQVAVEDPLFLQKPSRLVTFQFDNPTFEEEVTQIFERDLSAVEEPPDRQFLDVVKLGRPTYAETPEGYIRVSRLGKRATIRTRSGAQVGSQVHFFRDISTIDTEPSIELQLLGEHSGDASIVQGDVESTFVNMDLQEIPSLEEVPELHSEDILLDEATDDFSGAQLIFGNSRRSNVITIPRFSSPREISIYTPDLDGFHISYPESREIPEVIYTEPDTTPTVIIHTEDYSGDYYLHPSLKRRKRKRAYL